LIVEGEVASHESVLATTLLKEVCGLDRAAAAKGVHALAGYWRSDIGGIRETGAPASASSV
jgi:hypothetical protein